MIIKFPFIYYILLASLLWPCVTPAQEFNNIASELGITAPFNSTQNFGIGMSFYDFDGDGWDDLTFVRENDSLVIYRNSNGFPEAIAIDLPELGVMKQAIWVDYDNNGLIDLATTSYGGFFRLFKNTGDFQFIDVTESSGLMQSARKNYGISFGDYDRDGFLDFFVARYEYPSEPNELSYYNQLFRNNGDGTFENVTLSSGLQGSPATTFAGVWLDYNNNGWQDLYVINDRDPFVNELYVNNGDGTFTESAEAAGALFVNGNPMTATVGDFDNDDDLDIFMTNIGTLHPTLLLVNNGEGAFSDQTSELGLYSTVYTWGAVWLDFNNNGLQDLFVASSPIGVQSPVYKDLFYVQQSDGTFQSSQNLLVGLAAERSYATARGDWNNDFYYDIATHTINPYETKLWLNSGAQNNAIKITLQGTVSNRMAIGTWIRVYTDGQRYTQYTMCGENFLSQNSQHHIFGIGNMPSVDSVEVTYLSGHTDTYYNLPSNEHYYFTEGETYHVSLSLNGDTTICEGDSLFIDAGEHYSYLWNTGFEGSELLVTEAGTYWVEVLNQSGVAAYSDTIEISVLPAPFPNESLIMPSCAGDANGSIFLNNLTGAEIGEVIWSTGDIGQVIDSLYAGNYEFEMIDIHGCSSSGMIELSEPLEMNVLIFVYPEVTGNDGSILLLINGGTPPYSVWLDDTIVSSEIVGLSSGFYELVVEDLNNCTFESELFVDNVTSINEKSSKVKLYPNPAGETLFIKSGLEVYRAVMYDYTGRKVLDQSGRNISTLDMSTFPKGYYLVELFLTGGNYHRSSIIRR